jgi:hypothetical protein
MRMYMPRISSCYSDSNNVNCILIFTKNIFSSSKFCSIKKNRESNNDRVKFEYQGSGEPAQS